MTLVLSPALRMPCLPDFPGTVGVGNDDFFPPKIIKIILLTAKKLTFSGGTGV